MKPYFKSPIHLVIFFTWLADLFTCLCATFGPGIVWLVFKGSHASVPLADAISQYTLYLLIPLTVVLIADAITCMIRKEEMK